MDPTPIAAPRVPTPSVWRRRMVTEVILAGHGREHMVCLRTRNDQILWLENSLVEDLRERIKNPEASWAELAHHALAEHAAAARMAPPTKRHFLLVPLLTLMALAIGTLAAWWWLQ